MKTMPDTLTSEDSRETLAARGSGGQEELFINLEARIRGLATYWGCKDKAEDIAHDTIVVLLEKYPNIASNPEQAMKLANRVCFFLVRNEWRRRKIAQRHIVFVESDTESNQLDPERMAADNELRARVLRAMGRLSSRCKKFMLMWLRGATTEELCAQTGMKAEHLYIARFRCLKTLRRAVAERADER